jgi:hypothetical protein
VIADSFDFLIQKLPEAPPQDGQKCLGCQATSTPEWRRGPMGKIPLASESDARLLIAETAHRTPNPLQRMRIGLREDGKRGLIRVSGVLTC